MLFRSHADALRVALGDAWVARTFEDAARAAQQSERPIVTLAGELFRTSYLVQGGSGENQRGILETRREIRDLRERVASEQRELDVLREASATFEAMCAEAAAASAMLAAELHQQEKAIVGCEARLQRADEEMGRLTRRGEQLAREHRQVEQERDALDARQEEARTAIVDLESRQVAAEIGRAHV